MASINLAFCPADLSVPTLGRLQCVQVRAGGTRLQNRHTYVESGEARMPYPTHERLDGSLRNRSRFP